MYPKVYWLNLNFLFWNARARMLVLQTGMLNCIYDDIIPKYLVKASSQNFTAQSITVQMILNFCCHLTWASIFLECDFELRLLPLHELIYISLGCLNYIIKNQYFSKEITFALPFPSRGYKLSFEGSNFKFKLSCIYTNLESVIAYNISAPTESYHWHWYSPSIPCAKKKHIYQKKLRVAYKLLDGWY